MKFTQQEVESIQTRPYSFFIIEEGSTGFGVKVLQSGKRSFYYRRKVSGKRVDTPLGKELDVARTSYITMLNQTNLPLAAPSISAVGIPQPVAPNPLFHEGVDFSLLIDRYIKEHVEVNLKESTGKNYCTYLYKVQRELEATRFCRGNLSVEEARQELKVYIHSMKLTTPTQANRIRETLSSCFKWGIYEDLCYASPIYGIRVFKEKPKSRRFSQAELPVFFKGLREGRYNWRTAHCLRLILATGLRASEALSIRPCDINFSAGTLLIPDTKNGAPFLVPLTALTKEILKECVQGRSDTYRIFNTSVFGLRQVSKQVAKKAGITPCSTHDLRRTFGTLLGELGVDVQVIGRCLNHSSGGNITTRVYALHDMLDEKRDALKVLTDSLIFLSIK